MAVEREGVPVAEIADEARRTFDVGEDERDCARWQPGSPSDHFHSLPRLRVDQGNRRAGIVDRDTVGCPVRLNCATRERPVAGVGADSALEDMLFAPTQRSWARFAQSATCFRAHCDGLGSNGVTSRY